MDGHAPEPAWVSVLDPERQVQLRKLGPLDAYEWAFVPHGAVQVELLTLILKELREIRGKI